MLMPEEAQMVLNATMDLLLTLFSPVSTLLISKCNFQGQDVEASLKNSPIFLHQIIMKPYGVQNALKNALT